MKLPDNFQMSEHSWPCRFHILMHHRFMLRRSSLVECVSVLPGNRCLQNVEFFFLRQYFQPCLLKNPKYTFYTIKSSILIFFNLLNLFWHTDKNFCFYAEVNFWDFVRNDNSNKGTTARWNCQIIFRWASIHGRAGLGRSIPQSSPQPRVCKCLWVVLLHWTTGTHIAVDA
jgi:hypothetical protein